MEGDYDLEIGGFSAFLSKNGFPPPFSSLHPPARRETSKIRFLSLTPSSITPLFHNPFLSPWILMHCRFTVSPLHLQGSRLLSQY
ncbi:hypothetical protein L1887_32377 [Cichorium endivia]|nr:hypothetical protein L1887_32377 [Cichorium endivia]